MKTQKLTIKSVQNESHQFCRCEEIKDLSALFKIPKKEIVLHAFQPVYYRFSVPKSNGKMRHIEAPERGLKKLQRLINHYLQCVYFLHQSEAAFGYIPKVLGHMNMKNIKTNAERHLGCKYLLNVDFDDFFHQIKIDAVTQIFKKFPFRFNTYTAHTLAKICTFKGRLPMGAPTSPVLSNFYTLPLDLLLKNWADNLNITFTRFVDDLSFSFKNLPISDIHLNQIRQIAQSSNLFIGNDKTKFFNPQDVKIVTGLCVGDTVSVSSDFYKELKKDLGRLRSVIEYNHIMGDQKKSNNLTKFKQEIMGKINFIGQIHGKQSQVFHDHLNSFYEAQNPSDELSVRWIHFGNYF